MHELSIATSILDTALASAQENRATTIAAVKVRIGALAGVVLESLDFAWQAVTDRTAAEGARLEIEHIPVTCFCAKCQREFETHAYSYRCPHCDELSTDLRRGREMELISIEVD